VRWVVRLEGRCDDVDGDLRTMTCEVPLCGEALPMNAENG
jgi:hypothetical protein